MQIAATIPEVTISVIIPVFNESGTVEAVIRSIMQRELPAGTRKEIIAVDDGSSDGTPKILDRLAAELPVRVFHHVRNLGKGAALRTGLGKATGNIVLFQDSDLEYDPKDYGVLLAPLLSGQADVVYGSRFLDPQGNPGVSLISRTANRFLTVFSNRLTGLRITDMETGSKAFRRGVLDEIFIEENGFGVEPEITAKIAPAVTSGKLKLAEVSVAYHPRSRKDGKKIKFRDGLWAMVCIARYRQSAPSKFQQKKALF